MEIEARCWHCDSFKIRKNVLFDGTRSEEQQVRDAFRNDVERHTHEGKVIRASWESNGSWIEVIL